MSVKRLASGRWQADFWYHDIEDNLKRKKKSFITKNDAKLWEAGEKSRRKRSKQTIEAPSIARTIADMVAYYRMRPRYKRIRESTRLRYENSITNLLRWCKQKNITYAIEFNKDIAIAYESHVYQNFKGKGVIHELTQPMHIFSEDLKREDPSVKRNPFEDILLPKIDRKKPRIFTERELKLIFTECDHHPLFHAISLMIETGMRRGELLHLCPDRAKGDFIIIAEYREWKPKTFKSTRDIPLTEKAKEHIAYFLKDNDGKLYLVTGDKEPTNKTMLVYQYQKLLKKIKDKHGVDLSDATLHTFRRTFGYLMLRSGMPIAFISTLMGHESIATTERLYVGLFPTDIDRAMKGKKSAMEVLNMGEEGEQRETETAKTIRKTPK